MYSFKTMLKRWILISFKKLKIFSGEISWNYMRSDLVVICCHYYIFMCCCYLMPTHFLMYAMTKFGAENSDFGWFLKIFYNTEKYGYTTHKQINPVYETDMKSISLSNGMVHFYFGVVYIHLLDNSCRYPMLRTLQLHKTGFLSQKFATWYRVVRIKTE